MNCEIYITVPHQQIAIYMWDSGLQNCLYVKTVSVLFL
jgi:hypothetical protein